MLVIFSNRQEIYSNQGTKTLNNSQVLLEVDILEMWHSKFISPDNPFLCKCIGKILALLCLFMC